MNNAEIAERLAKGFFGRFNSFNTRPFPGTSTSHGIGRTNALFARAMPSVTNQTSATRAALMHEGQRQMWRGVSAKSVSNKLATSMQRLKAAPITPPGLLPKGSMGSGFTGSAPTVLGAAPTQGNFTAVAPAPAAVNVQPVVNQNPVIGNQGGSMLTPPGL